MLVNLTPDLQEIERRHGIAKEHNFEYVPQNDPMWLQETGIYQSACPFNFPHIEFEEFKGVCNPSMKQSYPEIGELSCYGVADDIEQIKEYFKVQVADPTRKFFLSLSPVWQERENKGKSGGWRWHKWGPYIGKLDSQCEYLDDEDFGPDFKYVICFHLYEVI